MHRTLFPICFFAWIVLMLECVASLSLPQWTEEEQSKLQRGEIIPGASLLVDDGENALQQPAQPEPEEELPERPPEPIYDPKTIPPEHLVTYFQKASDRFLVDPQRLLTMQETMDREGFLQYHAEDSDIKVRLYLFDALQNIPAPYSMQKLIKDQYAHEPLTAVVFFFIGDPSRTQLAFGGEGVGSIQSGEAKKMLSNCMVKSLEESDPADQVEAFIVQLSIKLYWLEKSLRETRVASEVKTDREEVVQEEGKDGRDDKPAAFFANMKPGLPYLLCGVGGVILFVASVLLACFVWRRNKQYRFPVFELPNRLGANYGAGVGAVLGFSDAFGSPASQRDQVPDYLKRNL